MLIHPTAPLYALTAFGVALVYAPHSPRSVVRHAWPGAVALLVAFVPYYVLTLHVLGDRYGVGSGATRGRTFSGRPVWEDALHFVAPGRHDVNYFTVLAAVGVVSLLARRAYRTLAFCTLTIAAPVFFFSVVPASGDSALFFDRYMIPVTPAFLVIVLAGCVTIADWAGALRLVVLALLVGGLLGVEVRYDLNHRNAVRRIGVDSVVRRVEEVPRGAVMFGSTGTSGALFSSFDYGHPANLLDHLVALRVRSIDLVDDDSCRRALPFLEGPGRRRFGVWLFYAASPGEGVRAAHALAALPGTRLQSVGSHYFVVQTQSPQLPRALVRLGVRLRRAWKRAVPSNRRVDELLLADRQLLEGPAACVPYGELGDPDISPHWPPATSSHQ